MTHDQILKLALKKMRTGVKKHGRFDVRKDPRNFFDEQISEQLDTINYAVMQIQRIELAKRKWEKMK